jgi:hypothetical protein
VLVRSAVIVLMLAACSEHAEPATPNPASKSTSHATEGTTIAEAPSDALDCRDPIAALDAAGSEYQVIGDVVALETSESSSNALQTDLTNGGDPSKRLFAKTALLVRTSARSELIVPPAWRGRLSFRWGNAAMHDPTEHLVVGPCAGDAAWVVFPGGYFVPDPACVDLTVRTADGDHQIAVGVGVPCVGQSATLPSSR